MLPWWTFIDIYTDVRVNVWMYLLQTTTLEAAAGIGTKPFYLPVPANASNKPPPPPPPSLPPPPTLTAFLREIRVRFCSQIHQRRPLPPHFFHGPPWPPQVLMAFPRKSGVRIHSQIYRRRLRLPLCPLVDATRAKWTERGPETEASPV